MNSGTNISEPPEFFDLVRRANRHLAAGEIVQAKSLLNEEGKRWAKSGLLLLVAGRIAEAEGQPVAASELFRQAADTLHVEVRSTPNDRRILTLADTLIRCGDGDRAKVALALARERGADIKDVLRVEQRLALLQMDWPTLRRASQELIAIEPNPSGRDFVVLARACRNLNDIKGAANAAAQALERDPGQYEAVAIVAWLAMRRGDSQVAIECHRKLIGLMPDNPRVYFEFIRLLILSGMIEEGGRELREALARWPNDYSLREFSLECGFSSMEQLAPIIEDSNRNRHIDRLRELQLRMVAERAPRDAELRRPVMVDDKSRDVIVAGGPNANVVVLIFTALNDVVMMPLSIFDRYLAALGITAVYLKDFLRLHYFGSIGSLGESYGATIEALRELCRRLEARRVCTLGCSAGGSAAIRYGIELNADRILSFAGDILYNKTGVLPFNKTGVDHAAAMIKKRLETRMAAADLDVRDFLLSRQYSSKIELVYGEKSPRDEMHARHLSGIKGVALHAVAGCSSHELLRWIALNGDLSAMLTELLGLAPI